MAGTYFNPGRYWGRVVAQALGQSSKGNPQFVLTFQVMGRINPEDPEGELLPCGEHYERTVFRAITDKTIDWVMEDLKRLGFEGDSFKYLDPNTQGFTDFKGTELAFYCEHETYEGKTREKWGIANESAGIQVKPLEPVQVRQLDSLFGKHLKKAPKPAASRSAPKKEVDPNTAFAATAAEAEAAQEDAPW